MLLLGVCVVLAAAATVHGAPTAPAPFALVEPSRATVFLKNALELRLVAGLAPSPVFVRCLVRAPGSSKFVELKKGQKGPGERLSLPADWDCDCGVRVGGVVAADAGEWTLSAEYDATTATAEATVDVRDFLAGLLPELPSVYEDAPLQLHLVAPVAKPTPPLLKCVAYTPRNKAVELAPSPKEGDRVKYDVDGGSLADGWCGLKVDAVKAEDEGTWVLEAVVKENDTVYRAMTGVTVVLPAMAILPPGPVNAEVGDEVTLQLQFAKVPVKEPGWKVCNVQRPDGAVVAVAGESSATGKDPAVLLDESSDLAKGTCVVRVTLPSNGTGYWTLSAGPTENALRTAKVRITVRDPYVPVDGTLRSTVGDKSAFITCGPQSDVLACELKDPGKRQVAALDGPCKYTLYWVRGDHRGNWTCSVVLAGYTEPVSDSVRLIVEEPVHAETGVTRDTGGAVTLRCVVPRCLASGANFCRMVAPDGSSVMLKEAVSKQGEYSYVGEGFRRCDCSMRITAPREQHYGVWRCYVGSSSGSRPRGGLIHLARMEARSARSDLGADVVAFTNPPTGLVPPGTKMTVGCRAQRALSYCFLRTPLGEQLLVNEALRAGPLVYGGAGLAFGECAVTMVMAANHSGTWLCGVGFVGSGSGVASMDVEVPVQLTVSNSPTVAVQTNVTAWPGSKDVALACRTVLGEAIQYCRFHRPDGSSVHLADLADALHAQRQKGAAGTTKGADEPANLNFPYRYGGGDLSEGHCGVTIASVSDADFGTWTCIVALVGDSYGTEHSVPLLLQEGGLGAGVDAAMTGMAAALATVVLAGAGVIVYRRYFRRPFSPSASDESIALEERQSMASSPGVLRASLRASPLVTRTRGRARTATARALTARVLGPAPAMQTSRLPARTTRSRPRSARRGSAEQVEAAGPSNFSDSSQEMEYDPYPHTTRKSQ